MGVVTFALAKENGFPVSDVANNEALDSTCSFWERKENNQTLADNSDAVAIVMTGNYDLWALSSSHYKPKKPLICLRGILCANKRMMAVG